MRLRNVARLLFARYFSKSPALLGTGEVRTYLLYLAREKQLSASSIMVTVAAQPAGYPRRVARLLADPIDNFPGGSFLHW
jgi:hypothetical protein